MVTPITLQEQMGATALVDQLRYERAAIDDLLDLPKRREMVVERIREYYRSQKVEVTEDQIEAGVKQYFAGRLTFKRPAIGRISSWFAFLYVTRKAWVGKAIAIVFVLAVVTAGCIGVSAHWSQQELSTVAGRYTKLNDRVASLVARAAEWTQRGQGVQKQAQVEGLVQGAKESSTAVKVLTNALDELAKLRITDKSELTVAERNQDASQYEGKLMLTEQTVGVAVDAIKKTEQLLGLKGDLDQIVASLHDRLGEDAGAPQIQVAIDRAREALKAPDDALVEVKSSVQRVRSVVKDAQQIHGLSQRLSTIKGQFEAMGMKGGLSADIQAELAAAASYVKEMDAEKINDSLSYLEQMEGYAQPSLTFKIADREGIKSGVERLYSNTGKAYYLIVEAYDAAGNRAQIPLTNVENGRRGFAKAVGVRVSKETYDLVKAQKIATGHVDIRDIGNKPANSVTSSFTRTVGEHPDMIDRW